jgi:hypothetical protein
MMWLLCQPPRFILDDLSTHSAFRCSIPFEDDPLRLSSFPSTSYFLVPPIYAPLDEDKIEFTGGVLLTSYISLLPHEIYS